MTVYLHKAKVQFFAGIIRKSPTQNPDMVGFKQLRSQLEVAAARFEEEKASFHCKQVTNSVLMVYSLE